MLAMEEKSVHQVCQGCPLLLQILNTVQIQSAKFCKTMLYTQQHNNGIPKTHCQCDIVCLDKLS